MKFERAYCIELKRIITPYTARELYFDEDGEFFGNKLNFQCEDKECRKELISVGAYREKKLKEHFILEVKMRRNIFVIVMMKVRISQERN